MATPDIDGAASKVADDGVEELERLRIALDDEIALRLREFKTDDTGKMLPRLELANLTSVRSQVLQAIELHGGRSAITVTQRRTFMSAQAVAAECEDLAPEFAPNIGSIVTRALGGRTQEIAAAFGLAREEVIDAINAGTTSAMSLDTFVARIIERVDVAWFRARTALDTAVMAAGRAVAFAAAKHSNAGGRLFVMRLVGPNDDVIREWCAERVGLVFTLEAIETMDNEQGLPVDTTCGGYNCRHTWAPMSVAEAQRRKLKIREEDV